MKHLRTLTRASLLAMSSVFVLATPVLAQVTKTIGEGLDAQVTKTIGEGLDKAAIPSGYKTGNTNLPDIIGRLISAALGLLGVVLLAYILYGGFLWMTAGGDEKKVTEARNIIKNAIIGLVIIVLAYSITSFVLTQIGTAVGPSGGATPK